MKRLLFAMLCIVSALGMRAQLTDGTVYWIQDVATGQFISQGANWGTQATVQDVGGLGFEAVSVSDGVYKFKNIMWNKVNNADLGLRATDGYCDQAASELTLTPSGAGYLVGISGGNYLCNNQSANSYGVKPLGLSTNSANATVWKFLTKNEYDAALLAKKNAQVAAYADLMGIQGITTLAGFETELEGEDYVKVDQTSKITNAALNAGNTDGWTATKPNQRAQAFGSENGTMAESWNGCVVATQTVSNLPNGLYKVSFVGTFRPKGSAESDRLTSDQTSSPAYVFANDSKEEFIHWIDVPAKANNRTGVKNNAAAYTSNFYTYVTDGTLNIGVKQDTWYDGYMWCPFGYFTLTQIYSVASYQKAYNDAMTAATDAQTSLTGFTVYATQKATLDDAITDNTLTGTDYSDVDKLTASTTALNAAAAAVAKEKAACDQYATIVSTIGESTNVSLTTFVSNAGFEAGNLTGWTSVDGGGVADNNNFSQKVGTYYTERWQANGESQVKLSDGTLTHDAIVLPAGVYQISATGQVQEQKNGVTGGGYFLYANSEKVEIGAPARYSTYVIVEDKAELVIKFALEGCTGNWISCDDVQLTYVGSDFPAYTLVTGKMSTAASEAQSNAESTYLASKTVSNYNALVAAIAAAQASVNAYAKTATAIEDAKTLGTNFNFATAAATTTFNDAVTAVETAYNDGTLSDASAANAGNLGTVLVGWHAVRASENFTIAEAYMQSAWSDGELNDWSTEGDTDGSNFHIPFFQNWTSDGSSLGVGTTSGQLTDLPNGLYSVSTLVRVRIKNGQEAGSNPTGITLTVNDGETVDACTGTQVGETQFYLGTITAEGLVKDGTLNAVFNRTAENNVSWLSFKDIKYTKVRDLTPEEMAVIPTAIALDETEVTLTADVQTKTFELTFTPENATNTVTWTSSDESVATVADGVVTAISSGTATITVTSTLDATVTASATVTVSFPETEVASEDVVKDGPSLSTVTYGDNLIKNGTFQYPNPFQGWKSGANGNCDANNYNIVVDGDNKYIQAKDSKGAGDSHSISTGWAIESGKTYVFGYKVKANAAGNSQYHVVSMTNAIGTETAKVSNDATPVTTEWTDVKYKFTNTEGYAFVQFRARWLANNTSFDDFYLVEVTGESTVGNVEYATAAIPTANIGTGAFQYSQDAVDAANALVQGTATVAEVEAAYAALTTVNAPAEGQLFNVVLTYNGWTYDNKAMTYIAGGRTDAGLYNIQYKEEANQNLAQAFTFTKVEGNNYKMSQIDADGNVRYMTTGVPYGGNTGQIRTSTTADDAMLVTVIPTSTEGVWNLKNTEANNYIGSQDAGVFTVNSHIDFKLVETTKPSITINTTAAGWGTTMLPFAVTEIPEGVKVYSCAKADGATLTLVEVTALEANKPYIIEGAWDDTLTGDAQGTQLQYTEGLLIGTYERIPAPNGAYILQKQNDKVGFFKVDTSVAEPKVPANRAYIASEGGNVKAFYLGGDTDGINSLVNDLQNGDIYDLAGRKVQRMQKGNVYIVNGKKVVVK